MHYTFHRVFCSTPGDLESERRGFYEVIAALNEEEAMTAGILLTPVSVLPILENKLAFQKAVDENVDACTFFVQVLSDTWGPPLRNFECDYRRAVAALQSGTGPLRGVSIFLRNSAGQEIKDSVGAGLPEIAVHEYEGLDDFKRQLCAQMSTWLRSLLPAAIPSNSAVDLPQ